MVLLLFVDLDPSLKALDALGGFFVLRTGVPPRGPLPTLADAWADPRTGTAGEVYEDPVTFRILKVAQSIRAPESRVAVSVAQQGLAARFWSIALGAAALCGGVPDLDPELLDWDPDASAPDDLWLREVRFRPVADLDAVVRAGLLVPLSAALRSRHRVSPALLWGNAGSALAGTVRQLDRWARAHGRPDVGERARTLAGGLLAHPDLSGTLDPGTLRRRSCCLYYRVPGGGVCGDCCFERPPRPGPRRT
ncbi:(2Fe-2S)-binding protein [Streptomyces sp. BF23-18]|uniref:(2Fe-2S)-binding protein n=1 Tax=Streptomyces sp. BF23-18 TaxID=3240282 RepID=UPI0034E5A3A9